MAQELIDHFMAVPVEDLESRAAIDINEKAMEALHHSAVLGQITWSSYHQLNNARKADFIYRKDGKQKGWTIAYIREQLNYNWTRKYSHNGEDVHENGSGRLWPKAYLIDRVRTKADPLSIKRELEWVLSTDADIETFWKQAKQQLEMAGIDLLQGYPDDAFIQDLAFLPSNTNFTATIIVSAGDQRVTLEFPIAVRYQPLIRALNKKYKLDDTTLGWRDAQSRPLQRASTEELQELTEALWSAVHTYDETKNVPVPAHIQKRLQWHMGEAFKVRSVEMPGVKGSKPRRKLKAGMERSGGSLDEPLPSQEEDSTESLTGGDTIADPNAETPDTRILIQQIFAASVDETDRQILHLYLKDCTQSEIATKLKISQAAISQRLKKLGRRVER